MTLEQFLANFPKCIKNHRGHMVRCPGHGDTDESLSVSTGDDGRILLKCFAGCNTGKVLDAMGLVMKDLFPEPQMVQGSHYVPQRTHNTPKLPQPKVAPIKPQEADTQKVQPVLKKVYSYTDMFGNEVYQALRYEPKTFRQRHSDGKGGWIWTMDGVERVLYRLPEVLKAKTVMIVEGEKDSDNLVSLGYTATCNVGGAGKWLDGYTEALKGKHIVICGDNDEPGQKHVKLVFDSIASKVESVKIIRMPSPHKDASDFIAASVSPEKAKEAIDAMIQDAAPHFNGMALPLFSMAEIEDRYRRFVRNLSESTLDLSKWLPSLRKIRPLVPGELVLLIGDTGTGKTALLQSIARCAKPLPTIFFEMELPDELMFERSIAMHMKIKCEDVENEYRDKSEKIGEDALNFHFKNFLICTESGLSLEKLESYIVRSELKLGMKPKVVLLDYIQLLTGNGKRYERTSDAAEGLKVLAKKTGTVIVFSSQITRPGDDNSEIGLHSAKDSGALENSAGLVIGAWRDQEDTTLLHLRVLKSTKGGAGITIDCNFNGSTMQITERSKID